MDVLKVLSYNLHKGFSAGNRQWKLPEMRDALNSIAPDLCLLQEVQGKLKKRREKKLSEPEIPQTEFLAEAEWQEQIYGKNAVYGDAHHGNGILSQHKILAWDNINVSLSKRASRSLLHAVIEFKGQTVHVICVHLGLFKAERLLQLSLLNERINEHVPQYMPLIIAGDFNDWQKTASEKLQEELNLREVYQTFHGSYAKTFPASRPTFQVDRIYYRGFGLRLAKVFNEDPWKKLSDHLPLYAELVLGHPGFYE
jgi:endonuclease/exonuclease/phosphatase family metal-dependent hydrolase